MKGRSLVPAAPVDLHCRSGARGARATKNEKDVHGDRDGHVPAKGKGLRDAGSRPVSELPDSPKSIVSGERRVLD